MVPIGVRMANMNASAMEWFTWMNSTEKQPARITSPASTARSVQLLVRPGTRSSSLYLSSSTAILPP